MHIWIGRPGVVWEMVGARGKRETAALKGCDDLDSHPASNHVLALLFPIPILPLHRSRRARHYKYDGNTMETKQREQRRNTPQEAEEKAPTPLVFVWHDKGSPN